MQSWLLFLLLTANFLAPGLQKHQETINFGEPKVEIEFGKQVIFQIHLDSAENVTEVFLSIRPQGESVRVKPAALDEEGNIIVQYDTRTAPLHPFSQVEYWFSAVTTNGQKVESQHFDFEYVDNRFVWKTLKDEQFEVHWYSGGLDFGQAALNTAEAGLKAAQIYLEANPRAPIRIFIYETSANLQSSLQFNQQSWVAGHASPDTRTILLSIAPGVEQQLEFERQIPHELMHLIQFEVYGEDYKRIPTWLIEGSASLAELYPNPDYQWVLERAAREQNLLPINSICIGFPREASGAFLSYAQSASFVRFLHQKYGRDGLQTLMKVYSNGIGCEEGVIAAYGSSLGQLENTWQEEVLHMRPGLLALRNLFPYLSLSALLLLIPLTIGLVALKK